MKQSRFHRAVRQLNSAANFALIVGFGAIILCVVGRYRDLALGLTPAQLPVALFFVAVALALKLASKMMRQVGSYIE